MIFLCHFVHGHTSVHTREVTLTTALDYIRKKLNRDRDDRFFYIFPKMPWMFWNWRNCRDFLDFLDLGYAHRLRCILRSRRGMNVTVPLCRFRLLALNNSCLACSNFDPNRTEGLFSGRRRRSSILFVGLHWKPNGPCKSPSIESVGI